MLVCCLDGVGFIVAVCMGVSLRLGFLVCGAGVLVVVFACRLGGLLVWFCCFDFGFCLFCFGFCGMLVLVVWF